VLIKVQKPTKNSLPVLAVQHQPKTVRQVVNVLNEIDEIPQNKAKLAQTVQNACHQQIPILRGQLNVRVLVEKQVFNLVLSLSASGVSSDRVVHDLRYLAEFLFSFLSFANSFFLPKIHHRQH
jgi:hypothetical protein